MRKPIKATLLWFPDLSLSGVKMDKPFAVKDFMSTSLVTFLPDMDIIEASRMLIENRISGAPVVDLCGNLVGMLSEKDCLKIVLKAGYHGEWGGHVEEYMHSNVSTIDAESNIIDAARMFVESNYRRYPVMKENVLVGQISRRDIVKALQSIF